MNKVIVLTLGVVFWATGLVFAQTQQDRGRLIDEAQAAADIAAKKAIDVGNKICPVSRDAVAGSKMGDQPVLYEYNGKIYHLCCPMCIKNFKNDPGKYSKIAEGVL